MIKTLNKYLNLAHLTSGGRKYFRKKGGERRGGGNGSTKSTLFNYVWPQFQIFKESISQSIDQPINQSINQSVSQSIIQSKQITNQQIMQKKVIVK